MQWTPGTSVSAAGHAALVVWLILGWGFSAEPLPFDVSEMSVVSGEEYARIVAATTPNPNTDAPESLQTPSEEATPEAPTEEAPAPVTSTPDPVEPPIEEAPPPAAPEQPAEPADVAEVVEQPPAPAPGAQDLPPTDRPAERPADRVASEQVAPPPPDADTAPVIQDSAEPDQPAEEVVQEPTENTAPEESATQIVPDDIAPSGAVESSVRPASRPNRPTPATETPAETAPVTNSNDDVLAALSEAATTPQAISEANSANVPAGPPMTGSEREGFRVAVNGCWNVDPGSVAARVTVEVGFSLGQDGKVQGEVRLLSSQGDESATQTAFQAARRAILRCQGAGGYQLPADKYGQWKDVVITFDPSGMRLR